MKISFFQAGIVGAFALLAFIGIFVFANFTGSSGKSSIGTVVIWGTLSQAELSPALSQLTTQNPGLKSVSYVEKQPATFESELADAIASGNGPDLVLINQEALASLQNKLTPIPYASLSARSFEDAFVQEAQLFLGTDGVYGIPLAVDPLVLYYNRAILSSSGIAEPPSAWEALVGLVPSVEQLDGSRNISRGLIGLGTYSNVDHAGAILSALFLQSGVPLSTRTTTGLKASLGVATQSFGGVSPGEAVVRYYTQFADPSKVSYTWNSSLGSSRQAFLGGNLALYIGLASEASFLKEANPNLNFDVAPLPQATNAVNKVTFGDVYAFAIPHGSKNSAGAYGAAIALVDPTAMTALATSLSLAPARSSLLASAPADPFDAVFYNQALISSGWLSPAPADTDRIFGAMITDVITGRVSLTQAIVSAENALTAALQ
jgi:multiple sugar transport system substrate-binding protein